MTMSYANEEEASIYIYVETDAPRRRSRRRPKEEAQQQRSSAIWTSSNTTVPSNRRDAHPQTHGFKRSSSGSTAETASSHSSDGLHESFSSTDSSSTSSSRGISVVCGMPYEYAYERGSYTGQIDAVSSLPHGMGTWRSIEAKKGRRAFMEGEWIHGYLYYKPASQSRSGGDGGGGPSMTKIVEHEPRGDGSRSSRSGSTKSRGHGRSGAGSRKGHRQGRSNEPRFVAVDDRSTMSTLTV